MNRAIMESIYKPISGFPTEQGELVPEFHFDLSPGELEAMESLQSWFDETKEKREALRQRFLDLEKRLEEKYVNS